MNISEKTWSWGLTQNAEIINGRAAMIGFFSLIIIELVIKQSFLSFIGLKG